MTKTGDGWVLKAESVASAVLAHHAADVDSSGRWPAESMAALSEVGLLGLTVPADLGGAGAGPPTFVAVTTALAEHSASTAMIYLMHVCATQAVAQSPSFALREAVLGEIAAGRHLSTLAVSEKGSRSHFWAPV